MAMAWLGPLLRVLQGCKESDSRAVLSCGGSAEEEPIHVGNYFFLKFYDLRSQLFSGSSFHALERVTVPCHDYFFVMATHFLKPAGRISQS